MPAFNFHTRFAADVENGVKRRTVRARRRHIPRAGQTAYLFTGMRTKTCRRLGEHTITRVDEIEVDIGGVIWLEREDRDGLYALAPFAADRFARADGFANAEEFVGWIARNHGLPFEGTVTYW